jgi:hypothetical protein
MAMPKKFELMLPLLRIVGEGQISMRDAAGRLARDFKLSAAEQSEMLSTGTKTRFFDRASWARVYLRQAGLIDLPKRGQLKITPAGRALLDTGPTRIDLKLLMQYPAFCEFIRRSEKSGRYVDARMGVVTVPGSEIADLGEPITAETSLHTEIQYLLLKLGSDLGLNVWVARNDRSRSCEGMRFSSMPNMLMELPRQFDPATHRTIELIDVLWMKKNSIVAAFEIESTTSIYSGLLRMSDLAAMQPNLSIKLFLVAPMERRGKVFQEINRPTFSRFSPTIAEMCKFLSFEKLREVTSMAAPLIKHLRPAFLDEAAESCSINEDEHG